MLAITPVGVDSKARLSRVTMAKKSQTTTPLSHFGFEDIPESEKQDRVDDVFRSVASRYDLMNDVMSAGLHRVWKAIFVTMANPPRSIPFRHLDVAGGSGDIVLRMLAAGGRQVTSVLSDINTEMLAVARERVDKAGLSARVEVREANAEALPFEDRSFDLVTIAFGIRNVPRIAQALREFKRVLRPGGRFLCLEFSTVDVPGLDRLYDLYSFNLIPRLGQMIAGDAEAYRYLVESIRRFPDAERFSAMMAEVRFDKVSARSLSGGIVAIHSGWRL